MQSVQTINKRSRRPRYDHLINKTRQQRFNNRSSLNQKAKNYDALSDPYTSYYFSNKSVKDHLKELKRALKYEPNFTERQKINKLLTLRIKEKFQDVICPKTSVYQQSLGEKELKKINEKSRSSLSNQRLDNYFTSKETNTNGFVLPENPNCSPNAKLLTTRKQSQRLPQIKQQTAKLSKQIEEQQPKIESHQYVQKQKARKSNPKNNEQKIIAGRLAQQLHYKKHQKWITFLQQKKKLLLNKTNNAESPTKQSTEPNIEPQSHPTPIPAPQPHPSPQLNLTENKEIQAV